MTIKNRFQGDPALFLGPNGSRLIFQGGQPIMDQGLQNAVTISHFTKPGWWGNTLFKKPSQKIGSDYEDTLAEPIVDISSVNNVETSSKNCIKWMKDVRLADKIESEAINPTANIIENTVRISPVGSDVQEFLVQKNSINWINQALFPASEEI
jgi:phage gp46-like protein